MGLLYFIPDVDADWVLSLWWELNLTAWLMDNWVKESSLANLLWFSSFLQLPPLLHYFSNLVSLCWPFEVSRKSKLYNQWESPPSKKIGFINSCLKYLKNIYKQNFSSFRWNVKCACLLLKNTSKQYTGAWGSNRPWLEKVTVGSLRFYENFTFPTNEFTVIFFSFFFLFAK